MFHITKHLDLVLVYTRSKLQAEAERTFLGYFWWILDPLIGVVIYYVLFKLLLNRGGQDYIPFLFIGLITWKWFENSVSRSSETILSAAGIFSRVKIHKSIFPSSEVMYHSWKFLVVFVFVLLIYAAIGYCRSPYLLLLPVILLAQFVLIYGIGMFVASITPFVPDIKFFVGYSMKLLFYPSGILFDVATVPEKYQIFVKLSFMSGLVKSYRNVIMYDSGPEWLSLGYSLVVGIIFLTIGSAIIEKNNKIYPKIC